MNKKILRLVHKWIGLIFGAAVTIICLSGAVMVFENEISEFSHKDIIYAGQSDSAPLHADTLIQRIKAETGETAISEIIIPEDKEKCYKISFPKSPKTYFYADPYDGKIKGSTERSKFFSMMRKLHRNFMLEGSMKKVGKNIVGAATISMLLLLISGLIYMLPKNKKAILNIMKINVKKGMKRFMFDLHTSGGIYAGLFLIIMAITGLTWSFKWYNNIFYDIIGAKQAKEKITKTFIPDKQNSKKSKELTNVQKLLDIFNEMNVSGDIRITPDFAEVSTDAFANPRAADKYFYDNRTGAITNIVLYKNLPRSAKAKSIIYNIHVGNWCGLFSKILTFVAALVGASLPITGYYIYFKRRKNRNAR